MSSKINLQTCEYARKSSIFQDNQLILYKRGICGGISIILSELCNRVGITAYPVFGTIKSDGTLIPHGWVAMRVDDSTYYIDPTYVCQTGEMDNLKMKNEMERIGDRQYQLEDSFEY